MNEIEKMRRYIELTKLNPELSERFCIKSLQLSALLNIELFDMLCLAFDYGRAKGYRMAQAEIRKAENV